jgi:hypothetical protein
MNPLQISSPPIPFPRLKLGGKLANSATWKVDGRKPKKKLPSKRKKYCQYILYLPENSAFQKPDYGVHYLQQIFPWELPLGHAHSKPPWGTCHPLCHYCLLHNTPLPTAVYLPTQLRYVLKQTKTFTEWNCSLVIQRYQFNGTNFPLRFICSVEHELIVCFQHTMGIQM